MKQFPAKNRRTPHLVLTVTLVFFALIIILYSAFNVVRYALGRFADGFFYPYLKVTTPTRQLSDTALLLQDKSTLAAEVEKLNELNRQLALQGHAAKELQEENRKLRMMTKLENKTFPQYISAEIILRDPLNFKNGFTIGKGSRDGVMKGAAVVEVNEHGNLLLVGVVTATGARSSKVVTVMDPSLRISGMVSSNQAVGFINTGKVLPGRGRIPFGMLPMRDDYVSRNIVTTTGFEHGIPAGIKIGELYTASAVYAEENADMSCELIPAVRFESLRFVSVVLIRLSAAPEELK